MGKKDKKMTEKAGELTNLKTAFHAYSPSVKPLGATQGGGFRVSFDVSEDDWDAIKELNSPRVQQMVLQVLVQADHVK